MRLSSADQGLGLPNLVWPDALGNGHGQGQKQHPTTIVIYGGAFHFCIPFGSTD